MEKFALYDSVRIINQDSAYNDKIGYVEFIIGKIAIVNINGYTISETAEHICPA